MRPAIDIVTGDPLPGRADLVVIGGGIVGVSAALWAAERGYSVALVEKGRIAGEQSGRNWGWVRRMGRDPAEYPLGIASLRLWADLDTRIGAPTGFRRAGVLYTARTDREMGWLDRVERDAESFGLAVRRLSRAALADRFPGASLSAQGGLLTADDGCAEPSMAAPAIARAAQSLGAAIVTGCAARAIETHAGRLAAVVTERGSIACDAAILAGGVWSRLFAGNLGLDLPQMRLRSSVLRTGPVPGGPDVAIGNGRFGLRPRHDGGYTIARRGRSALQVTPDALRQIPTFLPGLRSAGRELAPIVDRSAWDDLRIPRRWAPDEETPFERCRALDPDPQDRPLAQAMRAVRAAFPAFRDAQVRERWGGIIDVTPDGVPVIDDAPLSGLVIATGFSGHGFGIGPAAGQLAAEIATGAPTLVDPAPFRLSRFDRRVPLSTDRPGAPA